MKARGFDPLRLDVQTLANEGARLEGAWPLSGFVRLVESAHRESLPEGDDNVDWHIQGELRRVRGAEPQVWLHLKACAHIFLECQRCLQPVGVALDVRRNFRFVPGEALAAELDADCEDDVLALVRGLDLRGLTEDELLLSLPLVPMHPDCPLPLPSPPTQQVDIEPQRPHPFAALAGLKTRGRPDRG